MSEGNTTVKAPPARPSAEERIKAWAAISPAVDEKFLWDHMATQKARQSEVPPIGSDAANFEIDMLDPKRKRTGETFRLSDHRGKPVGLVFGSYT